MACAAVLALAACAPISKPIDVAALERSKPRTILLVISRGTELSGVVDPTPAVAHTVGGAFAARLSLTLSTMIETYNNSVPARGATPLAPRARPAADLELEIRTLVWGIGIDPNQHMSLQSKASLRLLDRRTSAELTSGEGRVGVPLPESMAGWGGRPRTDSPFLALAAQQAAEQCRQKLDNLLGV